MNSKKARALRKAVRIKKPDLPWQGYKEKNPHPKVVGFKTHPDGSKEPIMFNVSTMVLDGCQKGIYQRAKRGGDYVN